MQLKLQARKIFLRSLSVIHPHFILLAPWIINLDLIQFLGFQCERDRKEDYNVFNCKNCQKNAKILYKYLLKFDFILSIIKLDTHNSQKFLHIAFQKVVALKGEKAVKSLLSEISSFLDENLNLKIFQDILRVLSFLQEAGWYRCLSNFFPLLLNKLTEREIQISSKNPLHSREVLFRTKLLFFINNINTLNLHNLNSTETLALELENAQYDLVPLKIDILTQISKFYYITSN